jgi:hypothetical protein
MLMRLDRIIASLAVLGIGALEYPSGEKLVLATAVAQQQQYRITSSVPEAVHNLSVIAQNWHRYPGLAVADITFNNANSYEVRHPIIACDFFDSNGNVIATRGTTIFQTFPRASTIKIDGVHFSLREKNAIPGSCRVISVRTVNAPN